MSNEEKQQNNQAPVTPWNLAIYYRRIFPSHIYCKWLAYGERKSRIYMEWDKEKREQMEQSMVGSGKESFCEINFPRFKSH